MQTTAKRLKRSLIYNEINFKFLASLSAMIGDRHIWYLGTLDLSTISPYSLYIDQ
jgi:hypothetical protein